MTTPDSTPIGITAASGAIAVAAIIVGILI